MHFFYDGEFLDDGHTIAPISIGMVAADGREYYAVNADAPWHYIRNHAWLMANVVPHLPDIAKQLVRAERHGVPPNHPTVKPIWEIAHEVSEFIRAAGENRDDHELVAYCGAHDHVMLTQLWGPMPSLPAWVPMYTNDLKSMARGLEMVGFAAEAPPNGAEHNALEDARWNRRYWDLQVEATGRYMASLAPSLGEHVLIAAPTAARLIERMLSEGPNEGISKQEEADLREWWETYVYPPGEPEAGDVQDEDDEPVRKGSNDEV